MKESRRESLSTQEIELILGNSNSNFSGVTSTMLQVLSHQKNLVNVRVMGRHHLPDPALNITFWQVVKLCQQPLSNGHYRIFHARRVDEMIQAVILKYIFQAKIKVVFSSAAQRYRSYTTRWLTKKMDGLVAVSKASASYLVKQPEKIIYHGTNTTTYQPSEDRAAQWQKLGLSGKYGIGILGRVRKQKGVHLFVDACIEVLKKHPDCTAVIVGSVSQSNQSFAAQLKAKVNSENMADRIVFLGQQPFEKIPDIFRSLSLVTALSNNEGFGLTVLEAMSSGAAVLATHAGAWPEVIRDGIDGYVVPINDVNAISNKLDEMLSDPEKLIAMGESGRQRVLTHYTVEREAEQLCQYFKSLQAR